MSNTCHRCGAMMESGILFCSQCGAPQIRVNPGEPAEAGPFPPGTPADAQPPATPVFPAPPAQSSGINWRQGMPAAVMAAFASAVANEFLLFAGFIFIIIAFACGMLAVWLYRRRAPLAVVTPGSGARLGAVAGTIGFGIYAVFQAARLAIQTFVLKQGDELRRALREALNQAAASNPSPEVRAMVEKFATPEGIAILMTIGLVFLLFGYLLFSTLGGMAAAAMFGNRDRQP